MRSFSILLSAVSRLRSAATLAAALALPAAGAHAQTAATDTTTAVCGPLQPAELCVDFDASRSVDPAAGPLEYRWDMGDGTTLTGLTITHCYKARARYQVVLDVVVPATGEVRHAERTFDVNLLLKPVLNFSAGPTLKARVGQPVTFDALDSVLPDCQSVVVIWDFRDGYTQQGRRVEHSFRKAGRFPVRMSLRGYGPGACAASNCVSQEVVVEP
ncbi:PKD domain-containing protein [Hymenobacter sp. H14-R3]|uniref:PKD domain-containing protein n=1 Tax=Hymenobacter sp. H14-R3 TaxID=3046308 RepID=UPI0024BB5197|nr:PKD domain-containing protein [Hymenobacter sp. H14-R3]MDJ0363616.1 PKD domain-containing protein [Hymenobacter sp. H14-R3]